MRPAYWNAFRFTYRHWKFTPAEFDYIKEKTKG